MVEKAIESVVSVGREHSWESREVGKWEETPAQTAWWSVSGDWTWIEPLVIEVGWHNTLLVCLGVV